MSMATRCSTLLSVFLTATSGHAAAAAQQQIGSWVLSCPGDKADPEPCLMRLNQRFVDKAGVTGDLEVQAQGKILVPVIAVHGLSTEILMAATMAGRAEASIQFVGGKRENLACAASTSGYVCAPDIPAGQRLAAGLATAQAVTVRVSVAIDGLKPLPAQERRLDLSATTEALVRLRAAGPISVPTPLASQPPVKLMDMADRALKAAGYQNGIASLQALMAKYLNKGGAVR